MSKKQSNKSLISSYPNWFYLPAIITFGIFFILPTISSFYYSLTRWTIFDATFIGFENYEAFLSDPMLSIGLKNTFIYAVLTSGLKTIIALPVAVLLTSGIRFKGFYRSVVFFPVLISTIAIGITFSMMMQPHTGLINVALSSIGLPMVDWLGNPSLALYSVVLVDVWQGLGIATVIYMGGILAIPQDYFDAVKLDGGFWIKFRHVIIPLVQNSTFTVIILSFIGGLRSFDLIWAMTGGGPGFASDVLTSIIYKQYQAGFYGLSTAGNVILFLMVTILVFPLKAYFDRKELDV
ncbi:MAG: sugar ABC transporter permease [Spirochaetales bacterium]|nr:sugar ABC transporter permease [Spirochaetales bacterium]